VTPGPVPPTPTLSRSWVVSPLMLRRSGMQGEGYFGVPANVFRLPHPTSMASRPDTGGIRIDQVY